MTNFLLVVIALLGISLLVLWLRKRGADAARDRALAQLETTRTEANASLEKRIAALDEQETRIRAHFEREARETRDLLARRLEEAENELGRLRPFGSLADAEAEARARIAEAMAEASALRQEAQLLLDEARSAASEARADVQRKAKEIRAQAEALMAQATKDAGRIVAEADARAQQIGGDAYTALRDKESLERAVKAIRNVVEGYGDRYVIPTHSLLDELAADYSHTSAGEALKQARDQSRRMAEHSEAATCDYAEASRRDTAIRFIVDAFNGRVDAILTCVKHDNHGTLAQEIQDAFSVVNLNGQAFRNARILPAYLDARLAELRWAVVAQELRLKEREEQRRIQEQIREEEKARREYERAIKEAAQEESALKAAMEKARAEVGRASAQEKAALEARLAEMGTKLAEAEAKNQRALSMAQQTRKGSVYVISNVGSFGDEVFKIGMTRRLVPEDRIRELSDASVPFEFDVHAVIPADDAPALERVLHEAFDDVRVNKVNYRKEFFRVPLNRVREIVAEKGLTATFTMAAEAHEFRETQAYEKMTPEERARYHVRKADRDGSPE